ncbi:hypothetical protein MRX96_030339 [Rhipicephalus microplus]
MVLPSVALKTTRGRRGKFVPPTGTTPLRGRRLNCTRALGVQFAMNEHEREHNDLFDSERSIGELDFALIFLYIDYKCAAQNRRQPRFAMRVC